ncbi:hypothetical protein M3629_16310 [Paenibacillus polysaccharolyticus]|uniref:hypothetical protein n=1 Tax=Paenibacillus polysaccharolyticus TaxID=582692 RepID=UPI002042412A|nr:hypothetical protein [Paenibacillus polysaccharolyticus]MCM3134358.1 hypothetical protein [Paenibacillus polysaccharolyticus]
MNNNSSHNTSLDAILGQYAYNEQSSSTELIEFTLKSLQSLLPLTGFKVVKSRKALEMKTKELLISFYLQANRHNTAGTSIEVMLHCKVTHIKHKSYTGLSESYYEHSEIKWYELLGKEAFRDSLLSMMEYITQHEIPLIEQLISDPRGVIAANVRNEEIEGNEQGKHKENEEYKNDAKLKDKIFSPYFYYRYGTDAQFEQARQRYVASLSEAQKQQYDEVVIKFQADKSSPIKRGED